MEQYIMKGGQPLNGEVTISGAKNATVADYSHATAFEALIGYLYLTKQDERLQEILTMCLD